MHYCLTIRIVAITEKIELQQRQSAEGQESFQKNRQVTAYQTLEKFFATGYRQDGRALVPVLPPPESCRRSGSTNTGLRKRNGFGEQLKSGLGKKRFALDYRPILGSSNRKTHQKLVRINKFTNLLKRSRIKK